MSQEDVVSPQSLEENVTDKDIRMFKTTLLSRRFPALQLLPDKDVKALILADRKAQNRRQQAPVKAYPKTAFSPPSPKRDLWPESQQPVFTYINPSQAKEEVRRAGTESFVSSGTPYNADHADLMEDKVSDESKRYMDIPFMPACSSEARETIKIDYFLNGMDADLKKADLAATRSKGAEHSEMYRQQQSSRRGQTLV